MISIPGSLSFAKLVMMSSAPAKSAVDAKIHSLSQMISTPNAIRSAFFLRRVQLTLMKKKLLMVCFYSFIPFQPCHECMAMGYKRCYKCYGRGRVTHL